MAKNIVPSLPFPSRLEKEGEGRETGTGGDNPAVAVQKPDAGERSSPKRALMIRMSKTRPAPQKQDAPSRSH